MKLSPKILSAIVWDSSKQLRLVAKAAQGGAFDTAVDITIPAGTYYIAADNQTDDLLYQIMSLAYAGLELTSIAEYDNGTAAGKPFLGINSDGKVTISIGGGIDLRFAWGSLDGATIGAILGFTTSGNLDITSGTSTANYQSAYAWYAGTEPIGVEHGLEDVSVADAPQAMSTSGATRTTFLDERFRNYLALRAVPQLRMWSGGVGYTGTPRDPYARNVPLECWWEHARTGEPFRVYLDGTFPSASEFASVADLAGTIAAASTTTTLTDSGKSLSTEPQTHAGKVLHVVDFGPDGQDVRFYISSHSATVYTVPNALHNTQFDANATAYYVLGQRYRTYVVDLNSMREFAPDELPNILEYDITIPLLKYVEA